MQKYTLDKGWSGQFMVVVNNHPHRFFHIKCDWKESSNLVYTREPTTMDVVPPKCRFVLPGAHALCVGCSHVDLGLESNLLNIQIQLMRYDKCS